MNLLFIDLIFFGHCENAVHPRALKLFTLSVNDYRYLYEDGNLYEFKLEPVDVINNFIRHKWWK